MITTTLKTIRQHRPCGLVRGSNEGYDLLHKNLGKDYGDETPLRFSQIIESNGIRDTAWCLRCICPEHENEVRLFAVDCAERVLHIFEAKYPSDDRPRKAIQDARDFVAGKITEREIKTYTVAYGAADYVYNATYAAAAYNAATYGAYTAYGAAAAAYSAYHAAYGVYGAYNAAYAVAAYGAATTEREAQAILLINRFG